MNRALVVLVLVAGCHKESSAPAAPPSTAAQDALWAKAPAGAVVGIVASPRAVAMIEHGWHDLHAFMKSFPAFAPAEAQIAAGLGRLGLSPDAALADVGMSHDKGFAMFVVGTHDHTDVVLLLPVADRTKLVAVAKGSQGRDFDTIEKLSCKPVDGGLYGCATDRALLATLGEGNLRGKLDVVKARGDVEAVIARESSLAAVVQLDRGALVARGVFHGVPKQVLAKLGTPVKPRVDLEHVAGFATIDVASLVADLPPTPVIEGVTAADLAHAIGGPLSVTVAAGAPMLDARLPLKDVAPVQKVVEHCADLPVLQMFGATVDHGVCHVPVPQYNMTVDLWIEGKELRLGKQGAPAPKVAVTPSAIGRELAAGPWQLAFWGHGSVIGQGQAVPAMTGSEVPDLAAMVVRGMIMLNEIGLGVTVEGDSLRFVFAARTAWSNPDDVVAKLAAVPVDDIIAGKGAEHGKQIADSSPRSPFAADYQAGTSGLMIPTAVVGIVAAVAIPAFLDYQKRSRPDPAALELDRLSNVLKAYYAEHGSFPIGDAKALPDFPTCCGLSSTGQGIDNKCPIDPNGWQKDRIWSALAFSIDEPTLYRFDYHSDGKTVTAHAIADLDCDGQFASHELHLEIRNGAPEATITRPTPGVY